MEIEIELTDEDFALLEHYADQAGLSLNDFVVQLIEEELDKSS